MADRTMPADRNRNLFVLGLALLLTAGGTWLAVDRLTGLAPESPGEEAVAANEQAPGTPQPPVGVAEPDSGYWTLGGAACAVAIREVTSELSPALIDTPPKSDGKAIALPGPLQDRLRLMTSTLEWNIEAWEGGRKLTRDTPTMKVALFVRGEPGSEEILAAAAAINRGDRWLVLEARPSTAAGNRELPSDSQESLLAAPGMEQLAARHASDGRLQAELWVGQTSLETLQGRWEQEGWTVEQLPSESGLQLMCRRGGRSVVASLTPQGDESLLFVMDGWVSGL